MVKKYTAEFKSEAVKLVTEQGYKQSEAAKNLGVPVKNLHRWLKETLSAQPSSQSSIKGSESELELMKLRKEIKRLEMERDILKKATAFFARESL